MFIKEESLDIVVKPDIGVLDIYDCDPGSEAESQISYSSLVVNDNKKIKSSSSEVGRQCRFCEKVLTTKEGLKLHERRHTGTQSYDFFLHFHLHEMLFLTVIFTVGRKINMNKN